MKGWMDGIKGEKEGGREREREAEISYHCSKVFVPVNRNLEYMLTDSSGWKTLPCKHTY